MREFEERAMDLGHSSFVKEAAKYSEELGSQVQGKHPIPSCRTNTEAIVDGETIKTELRLRLVHRLVSEVQNQRCQGKFTSVRRTDEALSKEDVSGGLGAGYLVQGIL